MEYTRFTNLEVTGHLKVSGEEVTPGGGGGGVYCIDDSVVPSSVTIDGIEYNEIYLSPFSTVSNPFYIIPINVIETAQPFYLKHTEVDYVGTFYPYGCAYLAAEPVSDDPGGIDLILTVSAPVLIGKTEFDGECYLIPDTAEFKTIRLPR